MAERFGADPAKRKAWAILLEDVDLQPGDLLQVISEIDAFIMPAVEAARARDIPQP